jgi:hypothetical protein
MKSAMFSILIPTLVQIAFNDLLNRRRRKFGGMGIDEARAAAPSEDLTELFRTAAIQSCFRKGNAASKFLKMAEVILIHCCGHFHSPYLVFLPNQRLWDKPVCSSLLHELAD